MDELFEAYGGANLLDEEEEASQQSAASQQQNEATLTDNTESGLPPEVAEGRGGKELEELTAKEPGTPSSEEDRNDYTGRLSPIK